MAKKLFAKGNCRLVALVLLMFALADVCFAQSSTLKLDFVSWGVYGGPTYIAMSGDHLYVSSNAFVVLDISDRYNPVETGHLRPLEPGIPREFVLNGNYAYVLWAGYGIRVLDIKDDTNPNIISAGFGAGSNPTNFYLDFPYLYAYTQPSSDFYFSVIGISEDSTSLYNAGSFNLSESLGVSMEHYPEKLIVVGDYAYLTFGPRDTVGTAKLHILDVSSPDSISLVGSLDLGTVDASLSGMRNGPHLAFALKDTFLFVTGRFQPDTAFSDTNFVELKIINIANPKSVFIAGKFYSTMSLRNIGDIDISGSYAYVTDRNSALFVLDISNPLNPVERGNVRMDVPDYYSLDFKVQVNGNYAYLNMWDFYAVCIVDISDPDNPEEIGKAEFGHQLNDISVSRTDSNAYLAEWDYLQLYVVDSMETSPVVINRSVALGMGWGIDAEGDYAYLAMGPATNGDTTGGLAIFDISNPDSPFQVGQCPTIAPTNSNHAVQVFVDTVELRAYLVIGEPHYPPCTFDYTTNPGMLIVDVSNPTNPYRIGTYLIDPFDTLDERVQATDVYKLGGYAYLATCGYGVHIIDVSDPYHPTLRAKWNAQGRCARAVFAVDTTLYVACGESLCILNVSDPHHPAEIGSYYVSNSCNNVFVKDTLAFVVSGNALGILDISDPTNPVELASQEDIFCGPPSHLDVLGSYIYLQIHAGGLYTFEYSDTIVGIPETTARRSPKAFSLEQNYPNPFNSATCIRYHLSTNADVMLEVYNVLGQKVRTLARKSQAAGLHSITWDGKDDLDKDTGSGIYFYRMKVDDESLQTKKLLLLR